MDRKRIEELRRDFGGGTLSDSELQLLEDIKGFIDFGIRNGFSFVTIISTLGHDVNGLLRYGFDLKAAGDDGFLPKVSGYSDNAETAVGEAEEIEVSD